MEAAAVAAAAAGHGIGFAATKVISDELNFEMPEMERFIDARGNFKPQALLPLSQFGRGFGAPFSLWLATVGRPRKS